MFPEVIQIIQIDFIRMINICKFAFEKNESIYLSKELISYEKDSFYKVEYIIQYDIDNNGLKEVSRIEKKRKKINNQIIFIKKIIS